MLWSFCAGNVGISLRMEGIQRILECKLFIYKYLFKHLSASVKVSLERFCFNHRNTCQYPKATSSICSGKIHSVDLSALFQHWFSLILDLYLEF